MVRELRRLASLASGDELNALDPETGQMQRSIGVAAAGELWHATLEDGQSELRRVDPAAGQVLVRLEMPPGAQVSGLDSDGGDRFFCGGERSGKVRAVRRPKRA